MNHAELHVMTILINFMPDCDDGHHVIISTKHDITKDNKYYTECQWLQPLSI